jgi:hypothetical protein
MKRDKRNEDHNRELYIVRDIYSENYEYKAV